MLGPNEGIELLGATAGKGLIAAAASFEVVRRRYVGYGLVWPWTSEILRNHDFELLEVQHLTPN